jgi:polar amino acid transport system ATP-binding protein
MPLIAIDNVKKRFGDNEVLKGISLDVEPGEVIAIIGKSGSGKSTLLRCINGLESIDEGNISVAGAKLGASELELRNLRLKVGMIFQQFNLFPHLSVGRNDDRADDRQGHERSRGDGHRQGQPGEGRPGPQVRCIPDQLSGGQQQRVAIARALSMNPQALLCDEITSALDPELVNEVLTVMRGLAKEGMTLLMVTHEMRFAREVCNRLVFMHQGKVHEIGPPEELFGNPKTPELQQFIGMTQGA